MDGEQGSGRAPDGRCGAVKAVGAVGETLDRQIDKRELDSLGQTRVCTVMSCVHIHGKRQNWIFGASHGARQIEYWRREDLPGPALWSLSASGRGDHFNSDRAKSSPVVASGTGRRALAWW